MYYSITVEIGLMAVIVGSIPVGIVSARQRQQGIDEKATSHRPGLPGLPEPADHRDLGSMPLPPSGPLVSGIGIPSKSSVWCIEIPRKVYD